MPFSHVDHKRESENWQKVRKIDEQWDCPMRDKNESMHRGGVTEDTRDHGLSRMSLSVRAPAN